MQSGSTKHTHHDFVFNILEDELKKKWKSLRDHRADLVKEQREKRTSGAGPIPEPTWKWWRLISFLGGRTVTE